MKPKPINEIVPKSRKEKRVNAKVETEVYEAFLRICSEENISISAKLRQLMKREIDGAASRNQ